MHPDQSDTVVIALAIIGLIGTLGTAILTAVVAILTRQNLITNQANGLELRRNSEATNETHALVNGLTADLRSAEQGLAHAEGVTAGEAKERDRTNPGPQDVNVVNTEPLPVKVTDERPG